MHQKSWGSRMNHSIPVIARTLHSSLVHVLDIEHFLSCQCLGSREWSFNPPRPLLQVRDARHRHPYFHVQLQQVYLQIQGFPSLCSGCSGDSVGSVQPDLWFSYSEDPSLPSWNWKRGHSVGSHHTKLAQQETIPGSHPNPVGPPSLSLGLMDLLLKPRFWGIGGLSDLVIPTPWKPRKLNSCQVYHYAEIETACLSLFREGLCTGCCTPCSSCTLPSDSMDLSLVLSALQRTPFEPVKKHYLYSGHAELIFFV